MDTQSPIAQQLPQRVSPADMLPLMGDDVTPLRQRRVRGQVYSGPKNPQHKGRTDVIRQIYLAPVKHHAHQPAAKAEIGEHTVRGHQRRSCQPDPRRQRHGIRRFLCRGRDQSGFLRPIKGGQLRFHGHHRQIGNAAGDIRGFTHLRPEPIQKRDRRRQRHRAQQPKQHHRPQSVGIDLGRPPQLQPQ